MTVLQLPPPKEPLVTVVIAAFNAERFLPFAIRSALSQTLRSLEVVVIDDCSTDSTATIVKQEAERDGRVRLHSLDRNFGASGARNRGFALARGRWIAVMDSDDLMAPERLERLVHEGERHDVEMVADIPARFHSVREDLIPILEGTEDFAIDAAHYLATNRFFHGSLHYGLLKPIFRTGTLQASGESYDERLRIAEDDDFYLRLLLRGLHFRVSASVGYFYRQHGSSVSRHIARDVVLALIDKSASLVADYRKHPLADLLEERHRAFERTADYLGLVAALKTRNIAEALRIARRSPASLRLFSTHLQRLASRLPARSRVIERPELRAALQDAMRLAGELNPATA